MRYVKTNPKAVSALRDKIRITQQELAARVGCSLSAVQFWEAGRSSPRGYRLRRHMGLCPVEINGQSGLFYFHRQVGYYAGDSGIDSPTYGNELEIALPTAALRAGENKLVLTAMDDPRDGPAESVVTYDALSLTQTPGGKAAGEPQVEAEPTIFCVQQAGGTPISTSTNIPISTTAMPSPAIAAREPPPTGYLYTWTPNRPTTSLSIQLWRMSPSHAGAPKCGHSRDGGNPVRRRRISSGLRSRFPPSRE